jgi:hypothetical protein
MTVDSKIQQIYDEIHKRFEASESHLVRPIAMRGAVGFAALYTPPSYRASLAIVGQNPGNFGPDNNVWDDQPNATMMCGRVPLVNSYCEHDHNFAKALRSYFNGKNELLLRDCIGLNLWFIQAKGTPKLTKELRAFCEHKAEAILRILAPRVILCLSSMAYNKLRGRATTRRSGSIEISSFAGIPMIKAHHPTGQWSRDDAKTSIPAALVQIRDILASRDDQVPSESVATGTASDSVESAQAVSRRHGASERRYRITDRGKAFVGRRRQQLEVILGLLSDLCGPERRFVAEGEIIAGMSKHPVIQQSKQSPKKLIDWYRTHKMLPEDLAEIT